MLRRHALVTGGGGGIGAATALALKRWGHHVTILGRTEETLHAAIERGIADRYVIGDVCSHESMHNAIQAAQTALGPVEILVNNAGAVSTAPFMETSPAAFQAMLSVNLIGVVHGMQAVMEGMVERKWGRIINIASTAALKGYAYVSAYVAAKHAVLGLTRATALEMARTGVTVNALCPGFTDSDLLARSIEKLVARTGRTADAILGDFTKFNPQRRLIMPEEVGEAALFLCSQDSHSITGVALPIAGGEIM